MANTVNIRELALETLLAVQKENRQSHLLIRDVLDKYFWLTEQEKAFYVRLVNGTLEYRLQLDYILDQFSKTPTRKMKPVIREILRMGVYQMKYMNAVPDSAAVNESVKLALKKGFRNLRGFVNGVLRNVQRGLSNVQYPKIEDGENYFVVKYSMPLYLVKKWIGEYGIETTEKICEGLQSEHPVTVRVRNLEQIRKNTIHSCEDRIEDVQQNAEQVGTDGNLSEAYTSNNKLSPAPYVAGAYYLSGAGSPADFPEFQNGELVVQDVSSMLAVMSLGLAEDSVIVDLCAAPGGKSILASDLMHGTGHVLARDLTERKVQLIEENIARLGIENMGAEQWDATVLDENLVGRADVVIADVPCSGYGVIGKKPDIRYRACEENQQELIRLQRKILTNAVRYLKPDGILLFSTCTFGHRENRDTFEWLRDTFDLKPLDLTPNLPEELLSEGRIRETAELGYAELLPGVCRCDGFFFSALRGKTACS